MADLIKRTCGNCEHRDDDGDCLSLMGVAPMWVDDYLPTHIEPVDADRCADQCIAWDLEMVRGVRHG